MSKYHILGSGISGLLAAKAVSEEAGAEFVLYDKNPGIVERKGLHYLHDPCGMENLEQLSIYHLILFDESSPLEPYVQYSQKINVPLENSVKNTPLKVVAYNMEQAHGILWKEFGENVVKKDITREFVESLLEKGEKVISTIPLNILCPNNKYETKTVFAFEGHPSGLGIMHIKQNVVIYNTDKKYPWYRFSRINGKEWTETLGEGNFKIKKVMGCKVESFNNNLLLIGRYGKWQRGVLAHEAYYEVKEAIKNGY